MDDAGLGPTTRLHNTRATLREAVDAHGRTETRPVDKTSGRVLAAVAVAQRDVPHYDRAAVDGYAVRARDTFEASERSPVRLERTEGEVESGTARRIHTGKPVPSGANAVVSVTQVNDNDGELAVYDAVAGGENVDQVGADVKAGDRLAAPGRRLRPSDLAMCRTAGVGRVTVVERPQVSVIPTGAELVAPETNPGCGEVVETNGPLLSLLAEQWGGRPADRDAVDDQTATLCRAIRDDTDRDLVVTTGGTSRGKQDLTAAAVDETGEMLVHGVEISPGHTVGVGRVEDTPVLALPGYPVSCLVTAVQLLRPAIAWLLGTEPIPQPSVRARLTTKLPSAPGERTFPRVTIDRAGDEPTAEPVRVGGAGMLSSVTAADGWVEIPESREGIPAGEGVTVTIWEL